jgi:hypothetical protein
MMLSPDVAQLVYSGWWADAAMAEAYWREVLAREGRPIVMGLA